MKNMINSNIRFLRKKNGWTQEELAERMSISRQSIAKWESGESVPDIINCMELAKLFGVSIDQLVSLSFENENMDEDASKGKYAFGMVKVGERGQIVIPKSARDIFNIAAGDRMIVLGDTGKGGIALVKVTGFSDIFE